MEKVTTGGHNQNSERATNTQERKRRHRIITLICNETKLCIGHWILMSLLWTLGLM